MIEREGWGLRVEQLLLVHDCTLAPVWVTSVCQDKSASVSIGAKISVHGGPAISLSISFSHSSAGGIYYDYGPFDRLRHLSEPPTADSAAPSLDAEAPNSVDIPADQNLFVKGVTVGKSTREKKKIYKSSVPAHNSPTSGTGGGPRPSTKNAGMDGASASALGFLGSSHQDMSTGPVAFDGETSEGHRSAELPSFGQTSDCKCIRALGFA
jgi:hypothetical protein